MKWSILLFTLFFVLYYYGAETEADEMHEDPDTFRNVSEIITSKGYPVEEHTVETADGYLLSVQRIPHGRSSNSVGQEKEVVLLIHGAVNDATAWVLNFPGQSLGFILPDEGYDVWLLNMRGCDYSKRNVKYKTDQYQFWDFSFNEVAEYDIPATIDYILKVTGKETLTIIGYSQGTMSSFVMLSEMPDYNDKVKLFIALAPATHLGHSTSAVRLAVPYQYQLAYLNDLFTHGEFLPDNQFLINFREKFCSMIHLELCENILFAIGGVDKKQLNETRIDVYTSRFFSSTSTKSLLHLGQGHSKEFRYMTVYGEKSFANYKALTVEYGVNSIHRSFTGTRKTLIESKKFRKYDYGRRLNLKYYQQEEPPEYEISRITTPVALIWSKNDAIVVPEDVDILRQSLNSLVFDYPVPYPYNHFDFVWAENAPKFIYKPVLQLLAKY